MLNSEILTFVSFDHLFTRSLMLWWNSLALEASLIPSSVVSVLVPQSLCKLWVQRLLEVQFSCPPDGDVCLAQEGGLVHCEGVQLHYAFICLIELCPAVLIFPGKRASITSQLLSLGSGCVQPGVLRLCPVVPPWPLDSVPGP